ncbi:MAG TPA: helix-turn-helix domain-containing protein [Caulobacteraceae bacterium]|jgi:chromosomal replication initiation ATPase DnaA
MRDETQPKWASALAADRLRADFLFGLVALDTGIHAVEIQSERRSPTATRARQIAIYLAHVGFGWPLHRVACAFARDRSTVSHACHIVEDMREDRAFDARLNALEGCLKAAPATPAPLPA